MSALLPLFFLWLVNRTKSPASAAPLKAPRWPTTASPPPMAAFKGKPTPTPSASADPSHTSTPLADLHKAPPQLAPASSMQPGALKAKAMAAYKKKSTSLLQQRLQASPLSAAASTVPVADLQKILLERGVKVVRDGLYGPRTASAWSKLAASKQLPGTITRVGPRSAKVVARTYDSLSVPAIP